jgi:hypothetical protein
MVSMHIYDLDSDAIERISNPSINDLKTLFVNTRKPLIFPGLANREFSFIRSLNLDLFSKMTKRVPVMTPSKSGVNLFIKYDDMPMNAFVESVKSGKKLYIGGQKIHGERGIPTDINGLSGLADNIDLPSWINPECIASSNLWAGSGDNATVLHFDPWDSLLVLGQGKKEVVVIPDVETPRCHPYSAYNFFALNEGRVLHSQVNPLNIQKKYQAEFSKIKALRGSLESGDVIFIPAGFWHFVESQEVNVGINFFIHLADKSLFQQEPLRTFWIKDNITLKPVNWFWRIKSRFFRTIRKVFPKRIAS